MAQKAAVAMKMSCGRVLQHAASATENMITAQRVMIIFTACEDFSENSSDVGTIAVSRLKVTVNTFDAIPIRSLEKKTVLSSSMRWRISGSVNTFYPCVSNDITRDGGVSTCENA